MTDDPYTAGFLAGLAAAREATANLADRLEAANRRADDAERRAVAARADAAEQTMIALATRNALHEATRGAA